MYLRCVVNLQYTNHYSNLHSPHSCIEVNNAIGTAVNILVDSGSPYTIIPNELYENLFADIELCDSDITPGGLWGYAYIDARVFPGNGTIQSEENRKKSLRVDAWGNHYRLGHASET